MKRRRRLLFNIAAGVSVFGCVACLGLWILSLWRVCSIGYEYQPAVTDETVGLRNADAMIGAVNGHITFRWLETRATQPHPAMTSHPGPSTGRWHCYFDPTSPKFASILQQFKFYWPRGFENKKFRGVESFDSELWIPIWAFVLLFAILPTVWFMYRARERRREQRISAGLCSKCGYDLRATPERCPECGMIPPAAKGAAT